MQIDSNELLGLSKLRDQQEDQTAQLRENSKTRASGSPDASEWGGTHVPSKQWSESERTQGKGRGTKIRKRMQVEQGRRKGVREKAIAC